MSALSAFALPSNARRALAALALTLAFACEARAQAIFMTAPQEVAKIGGAKGVAPALPPPMPQTPRPSPYFAQPRPAATPAPAPAGVTQPPADQLAEPAEPQKGGPVVLRRLTNNVQGYRLSGEIGASEWPVYLTEAQARRKLQFQLGYLASVSVMPEASTLTLMINDEVVGETPIRAVGAVKTVVFDIPQKLMRPGFNSIRISTEQRHRVDCSIEATYELWTQIDPTQTGVMLGEADASINRLADLAALLPDEQGALPIRAVLSPNAKAPDVERMIRTVELISIVGRFEQPVVDLGAPASGRYGVNLVVGAKNELSPDIARDIAGGIDKPRAVMLPATPQRRTTLVITGGNAAQVDEAMKQFLVATTPKGSGPGLRAAAAFPGFRMDGGRRVKLRDLGLMSEEFSGRLFRAAFNIIMPPDFYAADYGRAMIRLAGGYAAGLTSSAQIVTKVNDHTAVSLSLLKASGDVFKDNHLPLPLGFLRPGLNRIEIEAHLPTKDDGRCDPLTAIHASNRFLFLDSTEIEMPPLARVGRMPDLAVTATGGFPYAGAARRPKLFLPSVDPKSLGAAATIVAHLAIAAGRPIDFEMTVSPPAPGRGPTLAVAPIESLDAGTLAKLDIPAAELRDAWKSKPKVKKSPEDEVFSEMESLARNRMVLQSNFPMACHPPKVQLAGRWIDDTATGTILRRSTETDEQERDVFEEWDAKLRGESHWLSALVNGFERARDWGVSKFTDAAKQVRSRFEDQAEGPLALSDATLAIGQSIIGKGSEDVWTIVTAPSADALADAVACLVDPRISRQVAGRVSILDMTKARMEVVPVADAQFVVTQPLSVSNMRLIAAGWLSLHSLAYVLGALIVAGLLSVSTRAFVRNVGRRTE